MSTEPQNQVMPEIMTSAQLHETAHNEQATQYVAVAVADAAAVSASTGPLQVSAASDQHVLVHSNDLEPFPFYPGSSCGRRKRLLEAKEERVSKRSKQEQWLDTSNAHFEDINRTLTCIGQQMVKDLIGAKTELSEHVVNSMEERFRAIIDTEIKPLFKSHQHLPSSCSGPPVSPGPLPLFQGSTAGQGEVGFQGEIKGNKCSCSERAELEEWLVTSKAHFEDINRKMACFGRQMVRDLIGVKKEVSEYIAKIVVQEVRAIIHNELKPLLLSLGTGRQMSQGRK